MSELQAEIIIRLMSDGKVGVKYSPIGPMMLYGMLGNARDIIHANYSMKLEESRIIAPASQVPRIPPDMIPPMMGNGK